MGENVTVPSNDERRLATELTALVLEQTVPEELLILDQTAEDYFTDPRAVLEPARRDEPLGFGLDVSLVAPYVLAVAVPVVQYLASLVADGVKDAAASAVADRVRRSFRRAPSAATLPRGEGAPTPVLLSPDQARWIHEATEQRARALGMPDDQARVLADAVVGSLITQE